MTTVELTELNRKTISDSLKMFDSGDSQPPPLTDITSTYEANSSANQEKNDNPSSFRFLEEWKNF